MIDPLGRWREHREKPDFAGLLTFGGLPYTEDPAELAGVDVAIVGAPTDDLVSDRPGTRYGPRAIRAASCPAGPHLEAGVDGLAELRVVDFGDAPVLPADPAASLAAIERTVGEVVAAGAVPIVLGGDHSIAEPDIRACAQPHGSVGLVHFDTHTDTGTRGLRGRGLARDAHVPPGRAGPRRPGSATSQIGLRGYWPGEDEFGWQREHGITSLFMHDVRDLGIREVVERALRGRRRRARLPLGRHRRARPGVRARHRHARAGRDDLGRSALGLPRARRGDCDSSGAEVVEVIPTAVGPADVTAAGRRPDRARDRHWAGGPPPLEA